MKRTPGWRKVDRLDRRGQRPSPICGGAKVLVSIAFSWRSGPTGPIGPGLPGGGASTARPDGAKRTDWTGEDSARSDLRWRQVIVSIAFSWRGGPTGPIGPGLPGGGASTARPDGAKWTDRTEKDSAPVLFSVVPSLCFHIVFLGKWTDRTDWTGITGGCSARTAASCISRMSHTMRQRHDMQPRIAIPALSQSQQFQRAERAICEPAPLDRAYNSTKATGTGAVYFAVTGTRNRPSSSNAA